MNRKPPAKPAGMTESSLKFILLSIVLFGASLAQPSFAKQLRAHHAGATAVPAAPKNSVGKNAKSEIRVPRATNAGVKGEGVSGTTGEGLTARGANSADSPPTETIDAGVTALSPRAGLAADEARNANTGLKITKPGNLGTRRAPEPSSPVVRNAIGQPVAEHSPAGGVEHFGSAVQKSAAASSGTVGPANFTRGIGGPTSARQSPRPVATASVVNHGKIDGAGLIRPAFATSGLGGPAKAVAGINGTTLRRKR